MTRGEIWTDFLKHTVLTLVIALFLFLIFKSAFTKNGETEYFYVWLIAVNFIIGGLIGGGILTWRLVVAVWYIPLTIYRLLTN